MELIQEPRWKIVFPIGLYSGALRPLGYLEEQPINSYDHGCFHVQPAGSRIATEGDKSVHLGWSYAGREPYDLGCTYGMNYIHFPDDEGYYFYNFPSNQIYGCIGPPKPNDFIASDIEEILRAENRWLYYYGNQEPTKLGSGFRISNIVTRQKARAVLDYLISQDQVGPYLNQLYIDAVSGLKITSNSIANTIELVGLVKDLRNPIQFLRHAFDELYKGVDFAKDLWLKYRYVYNTTKADLEEIQSKAKVLTGEGPQRLRASGSSNLQELHLRVDYKPYTGYIDPFSELFIKLEKYGFEPSLYNTWDLIPYSFIVDWFLPIGDTLERLSLVNWAKTMPYETSCIASSKVVSFPFGSEIFKVYQRFDFVPTLDDFASNSKTAMHTWAKRGLDVVSLL